MTGYSAEEFFGVCRKVSPPDVEEEAARLENVARALEVDALELRRAAERLRGKKIC